MVILTRLTVGSSRVHIHSVLHLSAQKCCHCLGLCVHNQPCEIWGPIQMQLTTPYKIHSELKNWRDNSTHKMSPSNADNGFYMILSKIMACGARARKAYLNPGRATTTVFRAFYPLQTEQQEIRAGIVIQRAGHTSTEFPENTEDKSDLRLPKTKNSFQ